MRSSDLRRREILRLLDTDGAVRVSDLTRRFDVSEVTVRKDLATLERLGRLTRVHGGGMRYGGVSSVGPASTTGGHSRALRAIADRAAAMVESGDVIFLDGSPVALLLAQRIRTRSGVTVVTNSMPVGRAAAEGLGITVVLLGGQLRFRAVVTVPRGLDTWSGPPITRAFVGGDALSFDSGVMQRDAEAAGAVQALLESTPEIVALVEGSAFARLSQAVIVGLDRLTRLLVDDQVAPEHVARLRERGIRVTLCGDERAAPVAPGIGANRAWRIGFANLSEATDFAMTLRRSVERAAAASGVVDLILSDNQFDGPTALRNVERFVEARVDLVIESLHLAQYGAVIMSRLQPTGIPVISLNYPMPGARFFGIDNYLAGKLGGDAAGRAASARWGRELDLVIVIEHIQAADSALARTYGQLETLRTSVDIPDDRVLHVAIRPMRSEARAAVADLLAARTGDRRIVILSANDEAALGAADAILAAGRTSHAVVVGQGGGAEGRRGTRDPGSPMVATVDYHPEQYGERLVSYALDILDGRPVPPAIMLEAELIERQP